MIFNNNPSPQITTSSTISLGIHSANSQFIPPDGLGYSYAEGREMVSSKTTRWLLTINTPRGNNFYTGNYAKYTTNSIYWLAGNGAIEPVVPDPPQPPNDYGQSVTDYGGNPAIEFTVDFVIPTIPYVIGFYPVGSYISYSLYDVHGSQGQGTITLEYFRTTVTTDHYQLKELLKPQIKDYFLGYSLAPQPYKINLDVTVIPNKSENIKLHYYQLTDEVQKDSDEIYHSTIDILTKNLHCVNGKPLRIKLDCVPCSISFEGDTQLIDSIKSQINLPKCFPEYLPVAKAYWESLYNTKKAELLADPKVVTSIELNTTPYLWAATPRWGQQGINDLNTGQGIGENVNDSFIYDKYFAPQSDETFGSYIMPDSALLKKIGTSLDADTWGINPDDPDVVRIDNLGWRIKRLCDILGIRVKTDGNIDIESEKKLVRKVIDKNKNLDPTKVGVAGFGEGGMILKRITNRFNKGEIVSDQCVIVNDLPQKIDEYFEQINLGLGIQESSAVQIVEGGKIAQFNNQLEMLVELVRLMSSMNEMTRSNLVSSLVTQSQSSEIIAGFGLPSVTKTIPIKIGKSVSQLPFKGIAAHRSMSQEIATCTYNVGLVTGQLL
jgi:hypothetical protein